MAQNKMYLGQPLHKQKITRFTILGVVLAGALLTGFILLRQSNTAGALTAYHCQLENGQHPTLRLGARDANAGWRCVSHLQQALNAVVQTQYLPNKKPLRVDGIFGNSTRLAVLEFQRQANGKASGAGVDGTVGPTTWNHIFAAGCLTFSKPGDRAPFYYGSGYTVSGQKRQAISVMAIQRSQLANSRNNGWNTCKILYF